MATKRKRDDDETVVNPAADSLREVLSSAIASHTSVEIALLHIMKTHDFNLSTLQQVLKGLSILFCFSASYFGFESLL
jgi:hypothetical protein